MDEESNSECGSLVRHFAEEGRTRDLDPFLQIEICRRYRTGGPCHRQLRLQEEYYTVKQGGTNRFTAFAIHVVSLTNGVCRALRPQPVVTKIFRRKRNRPVLDLYPRRLHKSIQTRIGHYTSLDKTVLFRYVAEYGCGRVAANTRPYKNDVGTPIFSRKSCIDKRHPENPEHDYVGVFDESFTRIARPFSHSNAECVDLWTEFRRDPSHLGPILR